MKHESPGPSGPGSERAVRAARGFSRCGTLLSITVGGVVLVGWLLNAPALKGAVGAPITMKANAALCLILAGASLGLSSAPSRWRRRAGAIFALLVAAIGGLTFLQHLSGWDFGIDQILFREPAGEAATASPGRMGPPASLSFLCIGLGLLLLDQRTRKGHAPFRYLPLAATTISLVSVIGYAFGSPQLYATVHTTGIAWPTAVTLLVLSLGVFAARPDTLILQVLCASNAGGMAARRLLIPALAVPFALLLTYSASRDARLVDAHSGRGILAVVMMVALTTFVLLTARRLSVIAEKQARAERDLRRNEQELNDFFETAVIGLHWAGPDGTILRANKADMALLGYGREEYVGQSIVAFHADPAAGADLLRRLQAGECFRDYPARLRRKDGVVRDVLITSSPLFEDGKFIHTRCFTIDVTDRKLAEQALRDAHAAQARLAAIVEFSDDAIVSKDLNSIITTWNAGAERLFGYTAREAIGQSIVMILPPERLDEETAILERIRRGEPINHYETVRRRKDGTRVNISLTISPLFDADGKIVGASKIARDVTERQRIEEEREALLGSERAARSQAERAARTRDEFLAVVSHELRTPLNGILGWSQYLKSGRFDEKTVAEAVGAIERGARAQAQLIEDLLDMNRITTGRLALDVCTVQFATVIEAAIATVRPAIESKQIQMHALLDTKIGPGIGDPTRLQQIVWNLLSNAVKFTPKGGKIEVILRRVESQAEIIIRDTGTGISPEFLPHVFERFRQADSSITRAHGGLGLGLAIVKHLVELHGGTVRAASEGAGQGSTFMVRLPLSPVREERQAYPPLPHTAANEASRVDLANIRVLVVDDDEEARELVRRVLGQHNAEVFTAGSAAEALEILARQKLDVLISDIGMPQMDGYQFIRNVRERLRMDGTAIPAVALTAYARSEDRTRAMLAGYQMHISKPIEPQELVATVASFMGRTSGT